MAKDNGKVLVGPVTAGRLMEVLRDVDPEAQIRIGWSGVGMADACGIAGFGSPGSPAQAVMLFAGPKDKDWPAPEPDGGADGHTANK